MTRANRCGQVIRPKAIVAAARSTNVRAMPIRRRRSRRRAHRSRRHRAIGPIRCASSVPLLHSVPAFVQGDQHRLSRPIAPSSKRASSAFASSGGRARFSSISRIVKRPGQPRDILVEHRPTGSVAKPADRSDLQSHEITAKFGSAAHDAENVGADRQRRRLKPPHLFDRVEVANLGPEQVDHDVRHNRATPNRLATGSSIAIRKPARAECGRRHGPPSRPTCRVERPEAITMKSAKLDLSRRSTITMSSALSASSDRTISVFERLRRDPAGAGDRVWAGWRFCGPAIPGSVWLSDSPCLIVSGLKVGRRAPVRNRTGPIPRLEADLGRG